MGVRAAGWGVRKVEDEVGTCSPNARHVWLNLEPAKKPAQCLEYIVVHGLAHLIERRHNDRSVAFMDRHLAQWRLVREQLNAARSRTRLGRTERQGLHTSSKRRCGQRQTVWLGAISRPQQPAAR